MNIIKSEDHRQIFPEFIDVLVDPSTQYGQAIAFKVDPHRGESVIIPMAVETARELCVTLMRTLIAVSELK
ncbi:hypothetical protein [Mycobacterium paraterrae]|uniref:Uncharacterized protein n=1 Tax=Mycobacterium paraterrae TaxID=577492 RepID=A0ABY3VX98_9MYCO|nr:hypothetical protein [Mycobacterium paraterrae]UMB71766.1 hypothetical protein MKK62_11380 [Mycobacterium paraterrae]